ncbi:hypothetical protein [Chthonobacter albigriseus]|uniref:hypothetical protein n=1 Tax=Chthonobacter albigriseus TaxID=1683161 RepID=UPI001FCE8B29|nr:hypothetical protein [Chthonobacter albigriseus]
MMDAHEPPALPPQKRFTPRSIAEGLATLLIAAGFIMLMQPFAMVLYTYSFVVLLAGTVLFIVGSKFPG